MHLCQQLRGVSYVNFVLTCTIRSVLSRSSWGSSRFANQQRRRVMGVEGFIYSDRAKKNKKRRLKIPPKSLQSSHQAAPRLPLCKWGQPFWQSETGVLLFKTGRRDLWRAGQKQVSEAMPTSQELEDKAYWSSPLCWGESPREQESSMKIVVCLLFSSVSAFGKNPALFSQGKWVQSFTEIKSGIGNISWEKLLRKN